MKLTGCTPNGFDKALIRGDCNLSKITLHELFLMIKMIRYIAFIKDLVVVMIGLKKSTENVNLLFSDSFPVSCREQKFIIQHYGGLCVSARNDNRLYLTASCSPFSLTDKKALRHVPTGRCVGPENHNNGARITLQGDCNNANTRFEQTSSPHYSVKHLLSGKCLHPLGGSSHPRDGTLIVLYSGCNEPRLKFKFHGEYDYVIAFESRSSVCSFSGKKQKH